MSDGRRVAAVDAMRGLVMALMAVDHVDAVVNPRHALGDSRWMQQPVPLSPPDFLTRWSTHLCAPTFVFLAGVSIALAASRRTGPEAQRAFDRHLALRGLVLLVLEFTYLSACFRAQELPVGAALTSWLPVFAQVIFTIGVGLLAMVPLRRLPSAALLVLAVALLVVVELANTGPVPPDAPSLPWLLALQPGPWRAGDRGFDLLVLYPALGWLPVMLLGHVVGRRLAQQGIGARGWAIAGLAALGAFVALRGLGGFGNAGLLRRDGSWLEWLHCSKYPPSFTFLAMELGLMALLLAWLTRRLDLRVSRAFGPLLVLGRVPLFFYLLHLPVIGALAALGLLPRGGGDWRWSWAGALLVVALCWPLCAAYGRSRRARAAARVATGP